MSSIFSDYSRCYPLSKTLRFSLLPVGNTQENIEKYGVLEADSLRADNYKRVKPLLDECHKAFIEQALLPYAADWTPLSDAYFAYQKNRGEDEKKALTAKQQEYAKDLSKHFKSHHLYKEYKKLKAKPIIEAAKSRLKGGKLKDDPLPAHFTAEELQALVEFDRFSTYFTGYDQTRENIYAEEHTTSVAHRIIEENFPKYLANIRLYSALPNKLKESWETAMSPLLGDRTLEELFSVGHFNMFLSQVGIDFYNTVLGGKSEKNEVKVKGLNELCNQAFQQGDLGRKVKFVLLYKQILTDRESASFIPHEFSDDAELLAAIKMQAAMIDDVVNSLLTDFENLLQDGGFNKSEIYTDRKQLSSLSQIVFGEWSVLRGKLRDSGVKAASTYTLETLEHAAETPIILPYVQFLKDAHAKLSTTLSAVTPALELGKLSFDEIKRFLDAIVSLEQTMKIFAAPEELDKDSAFYSVFDEIYPILRNNIPLYNCVRNYATKKPYLTVKFKLNFFCPTLADGWDQNKEYSNNTILLFKDGKYYLGIYNSKNKARIPEKETPSDGCYRKMIYKLLPGPNKMLPKVFFSKSGLKTYGENKYILENYALGKHKKGTDFDLKFCHDLIDYFKEKIEQHPDWSKFDFVFSPTESYADISAFYNEISKQNYKVSFSYITAENVERAVNRGEMFLFEIYNKDFSDHSSGKPNMHTLYWKQLFAPENLADPIIKLNGEAELFYRPASIENPFVHREGEILFKKSGMDAVLIADIEADIAGGMHLAALRSRYPSVEFRKAPHDIIKDRRYTKPSFAFHVPITLNYASDIRHSKFNEDVLQTLEHNHDFNIIGIDRGERNLIYISMIDQNGNILLQKDFNTVGNTDYLVKLKQLAAQRDEARKNWKAVERIKDVKAGYLSAVVREIVDLMLENNAILVMEDLNFGFKRGRFHIEQQVYQKFEKMLIDKLNYLASKDADPYAPGGIANAYQLTDSFSSFQKLGKQSGFLFYVPAANTSKIDPQTGFVNLFTSEQLRYSSIEMTRRFFETFEHIAYNAQEDCFEFAVDYSRFKLKRKDYTNRWTICTHGGSRISWKKNAAGNAGEYTYTDVTAELKLLFEKHHIDYRIGDLRQAILAATDKGFFERLLWLFKLTVQLRYEDNKVDYILSPVRGEDGTFFDSRRYTAADNMPCDGDANGAYHIALQGLRLVSRIKDGRIMSDGKDQQFRNWVEFAQRKDYRH